MGSRGRDGRRARNHGARPAHRDDHSLPRAASRESLPREEAQTRLRPAPRTPQGRNGQRRDRLGGPGPVLSYWDSAYIAKFYLDEPESDRVRALGETEGEASCSRFGYLETVSVFHRKMREGAVSPAGLRELCGQLEEDTDAGLWTWLPVSPSVLLLAGATLRALPKAVVLRAGDALHLATARANGIQKVFSNDVRLLSAAHYFEITGSHPAR